MRDAVFVGIDVSKGTLDVALRPSGESFRVGNDQGGISALVERLSAVQPELVVLEASGGYETEVVAELAAASIAVTVVNHARCETLHVPSVSSRRVTCSTPGSWHYSLNGYVRKSDRWPTSGPAICRRWWRAAVSWWRC